MLVNFDITTKQAVIGDVVVKANGLHVEISTSSGDDKLRYLMHPAQAVALYRCCMGEVNDAEAQCVRGTYNKLVMDYSDSKTKWFLRDDTNGRVYVMDANEALALAWGIKHAVEQAITCSVYDEEKEKQ
jgi:hypothetical protein